MAEPMPWLRSSLGLTGPNPRERPSATRPGRVTRSADRSGVPRFQVLGEVAGAVGVDGEITTSPKPPRYPSSRSVQALDAVQQMVELDRRVHLDPRPADQEHQHAVAGLQMSDQDATGHDLGVLAAVAAVAQARQGRPHPREHLAGENLFQHATDMGPLGPAGDGSWVWASAAKLRRLRDQRSNRHFDAIQYCSRPLADNRCLLRRSTGPSAAKTPANSTS